MKRVSKYTYRAGVPLVCVRYEWSGKRPANGICENFGIITVSFENPQEKLKAQKLKL